jgi:hypothetical protein
MEDSMSLNCSKTRTEEEQIKHLERMYEGEFNEPVSNKPPLAGADLIPLAVIIVITVLIVCFWMSKVLAEDINMDYIAQIESNFDAKAYNKHSGATGMYQITPVVLAEYNAVHKERYTMDDMYNAQRCEKVATWYMNVRIPQMMKALHIKDSVTTRIASYNAGVGVVLKHVRGTRSLPKETNAYLLKYARIQEHCTQRNETIKLVRAWGDVQ